VANPGTVPGCRAVADAAAGRGGHVAAARERDLTPADRGSHEGASRGRRGKRGDVPTGGGRSARKRLAIPGTGILHQRTDREHPRQQPCVWGDPYNRSTSNQRGHPVRGGRQRRCLADDERDGRQPDLDPVDGSVPQPLHCRYQVRSDRSEFSNPGRGDRALQQLRGSRYGSRGHPAHDRCG
jgi:hypothetical protein